MVRLDALGPNGDYRTRNREIITDTAGVAVAALSIVPELFVARSIATQRRIHPLPLAQRQAALKKSADIFRYAQIAGLDFESYVTRVTRVSGLPIAITRAGALEVAAALGQTPDAVCVARPMGSVCDWRDELTRSGSGVWVRRGEVLAVHASANHPGVHSGWPQALALGYRVAVRPSRREPFTAHRVVMALRQAGFRPEDVLYLPADHAGADEMIRAADLAIVFGGRDVVDTYGADPRVLVNGPGQSKILVTAEQNWRDYLDLIVDSISNRGGMACQNATAVLYEGDPAPLAEAIAEQLALIPALPAGDETALLPTRPIGQAHALAEYVAAKAAGSISLLGADHVIGDLGDGSAALRPAVHLLNAPEVDKLNIEVPFPCVWVSAWSRNDGLAPLRNSLVITAITSDEQLIDDLLAEPTVTNLYRGRHPTHFSATWMPHNGYLAEFLMRSKGFIRD
ncbi:aldehyde dehydrogenase family protein [Mycobacterium botniense]|uniref:aldehyde dehydrogenase family protein n=1 Tax=Mycobacterium botniense TaxID=84962 RepID=UPI0013D780B4|nr:aldehyde dehydrogenase family protein [Mycobacterium botniense]